MDDFYMEQTDLRRPADINQVAQSLRIFNDMQAGSFDYRPLCLYLWGPNGVMAGALVGATWWQWFYVELMFVIPELRRQGHGSDLLEQAEFEAQQRGARNAYLETHDFQGVGFYKKHGYQVFGELDDFPVGHRLCFMKKEL